jgi:EmrB/QacA subfamily drug resistance transporter
MAVLAVLLVGAFMILLDITIVNVALPTIQRGLHATYSSIEWVISGYALSYGLLLIPAGRAGDRLGHRRTFLVGMIGFTVSSLLCGALARTPGSLVAWRIVQGAMAGIMNPPILAIIQSVFPAREQGKAFGLYGAVAGLATALGPLAGGLLIAWNFHGWGWRPIFLVNVPIGVFGTLAALRVIPESRGAREPLDVPGIALVSLALILVTYPLIEGQAVGWPAWTFIALACAAPVLAAFALWERALEARGRTPLIRVSLFRHRSFAAGTGVSLAYFAGFIGFLFALSLHLQIGLGWTALRAGLAILPFALGTFVGGALSDGLTRRMGRGVLLLGSAVVCVAVGVVILVIRGRAVSLTGLDLLPALAVGAIGSGLVIAPNVGVILSGVPWRDAGSASGVLNTSQRVGQAIGVAVVGAALFASLGAYAPRAAAATLPQLRTELAAARFTPALATQSTHRFSACFQAQVGSQDPTVAPAGCAEGGTGPVTAAFSGAARRALALDFTHAVQWAGLCALGALVLTLLLVFLLPRRTGHADRAQTAPPAG